MNYPRGSVFSFQTLFACKLKYTWQMLQWKLISSDYYVLLDINEYFNHFHSFGNVNSVKLFLYAQHKFSVTFVCNAVVLVSQLYFCIDTNIFAKTFPSILGTGLWIFLFLYGLGKSILELCTPWKTKFRSVLQLSKYLACRSRGRVIFQLACSDIFCKLKFLVDYICLETQLGFLLICE